MASSSSKPACLEELQARLDALTDEVCAPVPSPDPQTVDHMGIPRGSVGTQFVYDTQVRHHNMVPVDMDNIYGSETGSEASKSCYTMGQAKERVVRKRTERTAHGTPVQMPVVTSDQGKEATAGGVEEPAVESTAAAPSQAVDVAVDSGLYNSTQGTGTGSEEVEELFTDGAVMALQKQGAKALGLAWIEDGQESSDGEISAIEDEELPDWDAVDSEHPGADGAADEGAASDEPFTVMRPKSKVRAKTMPRKTLGSSPAKVGGRNSFWGSPSP